MGHWGNVSVPHYLPGLEIFPIIIAAATTAHNCESDGQMTRFCDESSILYWDSPSLRRLRRFLGHAWQTCNCSFP